MSEQIFTIVTHGGAGSKNDYADGPNGAAKAGLDAKRSGKTVIESVCIAVQNLEDDTRFNAGAGSLQRSDGSIQMDAACMDSTGNFGAITALEGFKNAIHVAHALINTPYRMLAGTGAGNFARERKFKTWRPETTAIKEASSSDTVGAVAFDGEIFAAALSTGGTSNSIPGRVGDVPLIGCGLYAGKDGAVAATGHGESIAMKMTAFQIYQMMELRGDPKIILKTGLGWFDKETDIGLILVSRKGFAAGSNRTMAWAAAVYPND